MPARGGHFDRSHQELLLGFSFCFFGGSSFGFLGCSGFSFCFLVSSSFFFLCGLGSSFFFFGHFGWLGFSFDFCFGSRSGWRCGNSWLGWSSRRSGSLCESTSSEEASDQSSEDFVHLEFPLITLLEKIPRTSRRPYRNEAGSKAVDTMPPNSFALRFYG